MRAKNSTAKVQKANWLAASCAMAKSPPSATASSVSWWAMVPQARMKRSPK